MKNKQIIEVTRASDRIDICVNEGVGGLEILNSILTLCHILFTNENINLKFDTEEKVKQAFDDIFHKYMREEF